MHECLYYDAEGASVRCGLCPFHCSIAENKTGRCRARQARGGKLYSLNYGEIASAALDPIEKKPLYHFHPGSLILSVGSFGCNLTCQFCQNWSISQGRPSTQFISPQELVAIAQEERSAGNIGIAYSYNEPTIWFEYVLDTARLAHEHGLVNVLVTNGIVEEEPLRELLPYVDAMNVDIKSIREDFYRRLCGGDGKAARRTVELASATCLVEITNLIIPGENDSDRDLIDLFDWAASVSRRLPVHLSRYHPAYRLDAPPTPAETLQRAHQLARERLDFVYVGNIHMSGTTATCCPACGEVVVERGGADGTTVRCRDGRCPSCGEDLGIVT